MNPLEEYKSISNNHYRCFLHANNRTVRVKAKVELQKILKDYGFVRKLNLSFIPTNHWTLDNKIYIEVESGIEHCPGSVEYGIKPYIYGRVLVDMTGEYDTHPKTTTFIDSLKSWRDKYALMDDTN